MKAITNAFNTPTQSALQQMLPYGQGQGSLKTGCSMPQPQLTRPQLSSRSSRLDVTA